MTGASGRDRRAVLITGGARRIGAAIARALAAEGWAVLVQYDTSQREAFLLAESLERDGHVCVPIEADLSNRDDVSSLIPRCRENFAQLRCLINNAAAFYYDNVQSLTWKSWDDHLAPNLTAPVFLAKDFAQGVPEDAQGVIINMLDQKVHNLNPDFLSYTISKVGLHGLTQILAMALAPRIRVCGIAPGITLPSGKQDQAQFERAWRATPLGRSSTVEEIVSAVHFVLNGACSTGSVIVLDGGESVIGRPRDVAFDNPQGH